jgi:hypothetical protein
MRGRLFRKLYFSETLWTITVRITGIRGTTMKFRLNAFGLHLLASTVVLTCVLGILYFGWYRWPGWYLADALKVLIVLASVDLAVGPLLTSVVAAPGKPWRILKRDIAIIATVQIIALIYGTVSLWNGRPLYYAFSENVLQLVQAYDIDAREGALGGQSNAELAPHWYSLPRWIWAPLPQDSNERDRIMRSAITGGDDVVSMPQYFKRWEQGLPALRQQLKKVDDLGFFSRPDKTALKRRMRAAGWSPEQPNSLPFIGRGAPLLAVFDRTTLEIKAIFRAE